MSPSRFLIARRRWHAALALALALFLWAPPTRAAAQETNLPPSAPTLITNMVQFWNVSAAPEFRNQLHPVRMELLVYYCDTNWNVFWGRSDELYSFLPLNGIPAQFNKGDRILVDGWVLPVNQEFLWDRTSVRLLSSSNAINVVSTQDQPLETPALRGQFVEVDGLIDSEEVVSGNRFKLNLLAGDVHMDAYLRASGADTASADLVNKMVKARGVFVPNLNSFGKVSSITLWICGPEDAQVTGSLDSDPRFALPLLKAEDFAAGDYPALARVRGIVRRQQPGESVTIWDDTGQIRIVAKQRQPLQWGDRIEAVGYPSYDGLDRVLQRGLFRPVTNQEPGDLDASTYAVKLRLADQVRGLDREEILQNPVVCLQALVTFVDSKRGLVFVQDSSGGVGIMATRLANGRRIRPGMLVSVEGTAALGDFAPVVTNALLRQTGTMSLPDAPLITFEQAMTGTEDGNRIQLRGYLRDSTNSDGMLQLQLVAPGGEFVAHLSGDDAGAAPPGAIVLVRGVCQVLANSRRQLTGIALWSSLPGSVQVEQLPPPDLFAEPVRPLASLRQFNLLNTLSKRVHTAGTVTLQVPGRYLYLQDGEAGLFALSSQTDPLRLGDRVEVVGFSGNEGGRFLLREAVYRRTGAGSRPTPLPLTAVQNVDEDLDGLLVRSESSLLDVVRKSLDTRLILQSHGHVFEAHCEQLAPRAEDAAEPGDLAVGSTLAVTGVYHVQRDESGKPISFQLRCRNWHDIQVVKPPPWWTLRRLLLLLAAALPVFLLAAFSAVQTRRKNRMLERAQIELKSARDQLEERVAERTRELHDESEARQRALQRLSEAQQRLIVASREAGMAEVATAILHNVGNILNSINVSAGVIGDSLARLRIEKFGKAAGLLSANAAHLDTFLAQDPRGRALPGYLQELASHMAQHEQALAAEVKSLIKQIDHVKAVVAMQQGHARSTGFYETLSPQEIMDDALEINRVAFERHHIQVVRQYDAVPPITTDRHKTLQILINLLSNAKHALTGNNASCKTVAARIRRLEDNQVAFEISDNGVGIAAGHLERIFSLGFTTRADGHGFGLHSGANGAREMGGRLYATSPGAGRGATFILELPPAPKPHHAGPAPLDSK